MPLEDLPDAVIARLRTNCAAFSNRVAGTSAEAKVADQTELALPYAFYMPGAIEPGDGDELSPFDQHMHVRFSVQIAVDNRSDERGQGGASAAYARAADVIKALYGWVPGTGWAPVICEGVAEDYASTRATLWAAVNFRTSIMSSDM